MGFCESLNSYILEIGCTARDLANVSGISAAAISRYRAGERIPSVEGRHLKSLAFGIAELSDGSLDGPDVLTRLSREIDGISISYESFLHNLEHLLKAFDVTYIELARSLNFDPSYISRILSGNRRPTDVRAFVAGASRCLAKRCNNRKQLNEAAELLGAPESLLSDFDACSNAFANWLSTHESDVEAKSVASFLEALDGFDLDSFIRAIRFDTVELSGKIHPARESAYFYGIENMMACELIFLRTILVSNSTREITMYNDMPLGEMAGDKDFPREWMACVAGILRKGVRLNVVHDTNRPIHEMMIGLESWTPMYMTGLISPYYFDKGQSEIFCHHLKVADGIALAGDSIAGYLNEGRYQLTSVEEDVSYYRKKARRLIERAKPLMRIFNASRKSAFDDIVQTTFRNCRRIRIETCQPLAGMISAELVEAVIAQNSLEPEKANLLSHHIEIQRAQFSELVQRCQVEVRTPIIPEEEFRRFPVSLGLPQAFLEENIALSYEQYSAALAQMKDMADACENLTLSMSDSYAFRNITIALCSNDMAIVSKNKAPSIHFVIEHPALVNALENFSAPVVEKP